MTAAYVNATENAILADEVSYAPPPSKDSTSLEQGQQALYENCDDVKHGTTSKNWEVSREFVHIVKDIGKGTFSKVAKGEAWNIKGMKGLTTVAVKMLKGRWYFEIETYD